jgi:AcrR family transcriptional regulator
VALGSLYQYFPDRQRMLQFAVELCVKFVTDSFNAFRPYLAQMPLADALGMYLSGGVEWSGMYTSFLRLFARAAYHGEPALTDTLVRPVATTLREMVNDILAAAQARGELRDDLDLEAATRLVHALTIACGDSQLLPYLNDYFQVTGDAVDAPRMTAAFVGLVLKGIGRRDNA